MWIVRCQFFLPCPLAKWWCERVDNLAFGVVSKGVMDDGFLGAAGIAVCNRSVETCHDEDAVSITSSSLSQLLPADIDDHGQEMGNEPNTTA